MKRGDVYVATLDPTKGHEQSGARPVVIVQTNAINRPGGTVVVVPFTTQLKRAALPSCHLVNAPDGGLSNDSVALCHQLRVLDASRLVTQLGSLHPTTMIEITKRLAFTLEI